MHFLELPISSTVTNTLPREYLRHASIRQELLTVYRGLFIGNLLIVIGCIIRNERFCEEWGITKTMPLFKEPA